MLKKLATKTRNEQKRHASAAALEQEALASIGTVHGVFRFKSLTI